MKILQADWHRNGVSGLGFYVAIVQTKKDRNDWPTKCLVIRRYRKGGVDCCVFDLEKVRQGEIRFGYNSWRGDNFSAEFDPCLREWWLKNMGYALGED